MPVFKYTIIMPSLGSKITRLKKLLSSYESVVVCFSGGVDSSYLLAESIEVLGNKAVALTAVSPSLASEEGEAACKLAAQLGARHILVETFELDDPRYAANPVNRCYFCKNEVYGKAIQEAQRLSFNNVLDGFNLDDRADYRPGRQSAKEQGVLSPLDEIGFTKVEIRAAARSLNLPVWNKPALACLASRFPYGTEVTPSRLKQVAECERVLRDLGFRVCRVRYHQDTARIEVEQNEIDRLRDQLAQGFVVQKFQSAGFKNITVDPNGYRTGSLNVI